MVYAKPPFAGPERVLRYLGRYTHRVAIGNRRILAMDQQTVSFRFAYVITVLLLIAPYLLLGHYLLCLGVTMAIAMLIILAFNYYVSVAKDLPFRRHFLQMAGISLGVAAISFAIGYLIRVLLGIDL